jgi:hypothetical protein
VGRFLSPDPILQVENQYAYALGNPVLFQDPDGRQVSYGPVLEFTFASIALTLAIVALFTLTTLSPGWIVFITAAEFGLAGFEWANATAGLIRSQEDKRQSDSETFRELSSCSPTGLTSVPDLAGAFWAFAGLQLLLGVLILRRGRRRRARPQR